MDFQYIMKESPLLPKYIPSEDTMAEAWENATHPEWMYWMYVTSIRDSTVEKFRIKMALIMAIDKFLPECKHLFYKYTYQFICYRDAESHSPYVRHIDISGMNAEDQAGLSLLRRVAAPYTTHGFCARIEDFLDQYHPYATETWIKEAIGIIKTFAELNKKRQR